MRRLPVQFVEACRAGRNRECLAKPLLERCANRTGKIGHSSSPSELAKHRVGIIGVRNEHVIRAEDRRLAAPCSGTRRLVSKAAQSGVSETRKLLCRTIRSPP